MSDDVHATARVTVRVEIHLTQPWGKEATLTEIHKTASRQALETLQRLLGGGMEARIVGEPEVTAILVRAKP